MTFEELIRALQKLTPEQQKCAARFLDGDCFRWIADYVDNVELLEVDNTTVSVPMMISYSAN